MQITDSKHVVNWPFRVIVHMKHGKRTTDSHLANNNKLANFEELLIIII